MIRSQGFENSLWAKRPPSQSKEVAPRAGVWIETPLSTTKNLVALMRGAWFETSKVGAAARIAPGEGFEEQCGGR
jgi:hypothetical protein